MAPALEVVVSAEAGSVLVAPPVGAEVVVVGATPDLVTAKVSDWASWPVFCLSTPMNLILYCVPGLATKLSNWYSPASVLTLATMTVEVSGAVDWSISSILNSAGSESTESHLMVLVLEKSSFAFALGSVIWMAVSEGKDLVLVILLDFASFCFFFCRRTG